MSYGDMTLHVIYQIYCPSCNYTRTLTANELANWNKGESHFGSMRCPACSCGGKSLAQYVSMPLRAGGNGILDCPQIT